MESLSSADILQTSGEGGSSDADVRTFLCKKTSDFSKFIVCPHGKREGGGLNQCGHFADKGVGVNFCDFVIFSKIFAFAWNCSSSAKMTITLLSIMWLYDYCSQISAKFKFQVMQQNFVRALWPNIRSRCETRSKIENKVGRSKKKFQNLAIEISSFICIKFTIYTEIKTFKSSCDVATIEDLELGLSTFSPPEWRSTFATPVWLVISSWSRKLNIDKKIVLDSKNNSVSEMLFRILIELSIAVFVQYHIKILILTLKYTTTKI